MAGGPGLFALRSPCGPPPQRRRSDSLRSPVEPEVLIPVRLNKTRLTAGFIYGWRTRIIRAARSPCGPSPQRRCSDSLRSPVEPEVLIPVRLNKTRLTAGFIYGWRTRIIRAARSPCGPSPQRRRSDSLRSPVEPEVLIPVRLNKTRLTAGFIYGWRTRIIRAARSPCGPPPQRRRSNSLRSLVEPEVLIPVRLNKNPPHGGFFLWLAD